MTTPDPDQDKVLRLINGYWATALIGAAIDCGIFDKLATGKLTVAELSTMAEVSERGGQAVLDGLLALGLIEKSDGRYSNTRHAEIYLVADSQFSLTKFAKLKLNHMASMRGLSEMIVAGGPVATPVVEISDNPHWNELVVALAAQSVQSALLSAKLIGLGDAGPISILDIGGGSAIYSRMWLHLNQQAVAKQIDWRPVNVIARRLIDEVGLGDRFAAIDGDFHNTDFGTEEHEVVVYSHIAHQESPSSNADLFRRIRRALKPGGSLVICDYVVDNDRSGPPFALTFASEMLVKSQYGSTWRACDYQNWLAVAGFQRTTFHPVHPATVILAQVPTVRGD